VVDRICYPGDMLSADCRVMAATARIACGWNNFKQLSSFLTAKVHHLDSSSSSRMSVMNHNWSARKQHLHLQSAAGISRHSAFSEDRIQQRGTSSGSRHKDTDQSL